MIVIVVKKLRGFIKGQFWWNHHQNARAKKFVHPSAPNGIVFKEPVQALLYIAIQP
jgi:hypothetical protein